LPTLAAATAAVAEPVAAQPISELREHPVPAPERGNPSLFTIGALNADSINHKFTAIADIVSEMNCSVVCITESWHQDTKDVAVLKQQDFVIRIHTGRPAMDGRCVS